MDTDTILHAPETSKGFWLIGYGLVGRLDVFRVGAKPTPIPASRNLEQQTLPQVNDIVMAAKRLLNA